MQVTEMSAALAEVADRVTADDLDGARRVAADQLPFVPQQRDGRTFTARQMTEVMVRDGFVDRYTGCPVWHPGALRLLSLLLPDHLPWHPHGKLASSHALYWDLAPSIDHIAALTRGGGHDLDNWITTSWAKNLHKSNLNLAQTGWQLHAPGRIEDWDGYLGWFLAELDRRPEMRSVPYLCRWYGVALAVLRERGIDPPTLPSIQRRSAERQEGVVTEP